MSPVLEITVPTALPAASSVDPCIAAITETVISGNVVAMLTMVAPIMKAGIPAALAIQLAESTNRSPPLATRNIPAMSRTAADRMWCISFPPKKNGMPVHTGMGLAAIRARVW